MKLSFGTLRLSCPPPLIDDVFYEWLGSLVKSDTAGGVTMAQL